MNDPAGSLSGDRYSGGDALAASRFDLGSLIESVGARLGPAAREKGISLELKRAAGIPAVVVGQERELGDALSALIGNAVRFTDAGEVVASVTCEPASGGRTLLHVEISDTGRGIADGTIAALFDSGHRAGEPPAPSPEAGGLIRSRRTIELMDGRFGCSSEIGTGTTVWFTVPLDLAE